MKGKFTLGKTFPALTNANGLDSGGFHYAYYECDSNKLLIEKSKPLQQGAMNADFNLNNFSFKAPFACIIEGYLKCSNEGYYTFFIEADSLAKIYIDDKLLTAIDYSLDKLTSKSFILSLAKGFHEFRVEYFHKSGDRILSATYLPPSLPDAGKLAHLPINIPFNLQYRKPEK